MRNLDVHFQAFIGFLLKCTDVPAFVCVVHKYVENVFFSTYVRMYKVYVCTLVHTYVPRYIHWPQKSLVDVYVCFHLLSHQLVNMCAFAACTVTFVCIYLYTCVHVYVFVCRMCLATS